MIVLHPSPLPARTRSPRIGPEQADPPRTLTALLASEQAAGAAVQAIAADAETLGMVLPMFDRVSATTAGPHALLSERGGYAPVRLAGQRQPPMHKRIFLRLASGRGERVVMTAADPARRRPAGLHLFAADGQLCHRTEISAPEDLLVLAGLCAELADGPVAALPPGGVPPAAEPSRAPVSIPLIRHTRSEWPGMTEAMHLDEILLDGGVGRAACLRHLGNAFARPVPPGRLTPFLHHLAGHRVAFRRIVTRPGCLQSHSGAAELVPTGNDLLLLRSKASLFALDNTAITACWLTWWDLDGDPRAVVEVYGGDGLCLALLTGRAESAQEAELWTRLAGLLAAR
ncbi:MAG: hypothetical protein QM682_16170 [Paracoccus sp. (in: a-proteobacteria)]|uniref:hypothetical protein n=1 Tax=Paracoccus sp. TaxID=267 RepID=UPI0039E2F42F